MSDKKQQQFPNDGHRWTYSDGFGSENKQSVQRYSVAENERITTPDSNRMRRELDPQKDLEQEVEVKRWNEDVCTLVRLAFCDKIVKREGNYALQSGDVYIVFPEVHTLTDLYFLYRKIPASVQAEIKSLYARVWNTEHVLCLVKDPAPYLPQMERVCAQLKEELPLMVSRPFVPKELFWLCPRRTALLAYENACRDLKNAKK